MTASSPRPAGGGCWCGPTPDEPHPWEPFEVNLCDPDGIVRRGAMHHGQDYVCTGSAHFSGLHIRCTTGTTADHRLDVKGRLPVAAPDTTGGELREEMWSAAEAAIAAYMLSGSSSLGTRWSASDAEDLGALAVDAVLALPALRDLLAERDTLAAQVRAVEGVMTRCNNARGYHAAAGDVADALAYDNAGEWIRRALGTPTTGGGE